MFFFRDTVYIIGLLSVDEISTIDNDNPEFAKKHSVEGISPTSVLVSTQ